MHNSYLFCNENGDLAKQKGQELINNFSYMAGQTVEISEAYPANNYKALGLLGSLRPDPNAPHEKKKPPSSGLCLGNPKDIIETIKRWELAGVDQLIFMVQAREHLDQKDVLTSLRLFGSEVMPCFSSGKTDLAMSS